MKKITTITLFTLPFLISAQSLNYAYNFISDNLAITRIDFNTNIDSKTSLITPPTHTETFSNIPEMKTFSDVSYIGDNGIRWFVNGGKSEKANKLDDKSNNIQLCSGFKGIYATIPGGVSSFYVKVKNTTDNVRDLELFINGISKGKITEKSKDLNTFEINNINIEGNISINLKNTSEDKNGDAIQFSIDDISWNSYEEPDHKQYRKDTKPKPSLNAILGINE